ncbi:Peptidase family M13 [Nesidiocoris tenuis]|uniref:Peptidase family M13 n=1 Tax=Nesidiocoris tenuis TaxID=355587 RepID=A0ABN7B5Y7_9HEMI|nr:Peptidase family M13 [Nesidiocoris tenuis]
MENTEDTIFSKTPRKKLENYFTFSLFALALLVVALLVTIFVGNKLNVIDTCQTKQCIHSAAAVLEAINSSVDPCDDFYEFACGNWKADYPATIEDEFYPLQNWMTELSIKQKAAILDQLRRGNSINDPSSVRAARRVFRACQDFGAINAFGLGSLWELLDKLGLPKNPLNKTGSEISWVRSLGKSMRYLGLDPIVGLSVTPDPKNSSSNLLTLFSPEDSADDGIFGGWNANRLMSRKMSSLTGVHQWDSSTSKIIGYMAEADGEKLNSTKSLLPLASSIRKVFIIINEAVKTDSYPKYIGSATPSLMTVADFQQLLDESTTTGSSKLQIMPLLEEILSDFQDLNINLDKVLLKIYRLRYFQSLSRLLERLEEKELELFIWWKVVSLLAVHTNEDLMVLKEKMMRQLSDGRFPTLPRETICYYNVAQLMKPSLGYFVLQEIDRTKIEQVKSMISKIAAAQISTISRQKWIDLKTKRDSFEKVKSTEFHVGFPKWMEHLSNFDLLYRSRGENRTGVKEGQIPIYEFQHLKNLETLVDFAVKKMIRKLENRRDRHHNDFDPTQVNIYYTADTNSITIPYSILKLPLYGWENDALSYGAIGAFIGHELNHGFDTIGRFYDKDGNFRDWWSKSAARQHDERASCFVEQYSKFHSPKYNSSLRFDGNLTIQENMADNGGLKVAFEAYRASARRRNIVSKLPGLQAYSNEQLFFLSFARAKCSKYTTQGLAAVLNDVHVPDFARVLVTLRNSAEFSKAWNCPRGSFMNPKEKCEFWS